MVQNKNNIELEIILTLIRKEMHLREIARTLNESHSTVLRKINEFVKEDVLDYKKEGKNKVFYIRKNLKAKNYVYFAEIYKLTKLIKKYPELGVIFEDEKKNLPKGMILLFGSYAKGNPSKESDIDLYIETSSNNLKHKLKELNSKINIKAGKFDVNSLLIKEIIKNHAIIRGFEEFYEKNGFFD